MPTPSSDPDPDDLATFLRSIYPSNLFGPPTTPPSRPFVTLTYAQSLDGKIAGPAGTQIRLSGQESMVLTHRLRELHDFILVGVGTMLSDNPQLNARLPALLPLASQPRPIVLDSNLRTPPASKLLENHRSNIGHQPTIICAKTPTDSTLCARRAALEHHGAKVVESPTDNRGRVVLSHILENVTPGASLMVEGGASVISAFLASGLVDLVIITIAPVMVGDGVSMLLEHAQTQTPTTADRSFFWNSENSNQLTIPQCASWQFTTSADSTGTKSAVGPYYLQFAPVDDPVTQEIISTIGGSGNWTANYPVGTQITLTMVDAAGSSGGSVSGYSIVAGSSSCTCTMASTTTGVTLDVNPEDDPCGTMDLNITGGSAPYVVSIWAPTSINQANLTGVTNTTLSITNPVLAGAQFFSEQHLLSRFRLLPGEND